MHNCTYMCNSTHICVWLICMFCSTQVWSFIGLPCHSLCGVSDANLICGDHISVQDWYADVDVDVGVGVESIFLSKGWKFRFKSSMSIVFRQCFCQSSVSWFWTCIKMMINTLHFYLICRCFTFPPLDFLLCFCICMDGVNGLVCRPASHSCSPPFSHTLLCSAEKGTLHLA